MQNQWKVQPIIQPLQAFYQEPESPGMPRHPEDCSVEGISVNAPAPKELGPFLNHICVRGHGGIFV